MHILRCKCNCYHSGKTPKIESLNGLGSVTQSTAHLVPNGDKRGRRRREDDKYDDDNEGEHDDNNDDGNEDDHDHDDSTIESVTEHNILRLQNK